jgi:thioredoxin-related protein
MKYHQYIILLLVFGFFSSFIKPKPAIKWYKWNEGYELAKKQNKPVYVHVYASWCPYCKQMDKEIYTDPELINKMNENFINIRFNPEDNKEIYKMDKYVLNGSQLLLLIGNKKLTGYPGEIFIFPGGKGIFVASGYKKKTEMQELVSKVLSKREPFVEIPNSADSTKMQSPFKEGTITPEVKTKDVQIIDIE